jgi:hypothetical protein
MEEAAKFFPQIVPLMLYASSLTSPPHPHTHPLPTHQSVDADGGEYTVELLEGLWHIKRWVPREAKALLTVAGSMVVGFQCLTEVCESVAGGGDSFTSWAGIISATTAGAVLAWFTSPRYKIRTAVLAELDLEDGASGGTSRGSSSATYTSSSSSSSSAGSGDSRTASSAALAASSPGSAGASPSPASGSLSPESPKKDCIVLTDETSDLARAWNALGFNLALYLAATGWLSTQASDFPPPPPPMPPMM